MAKKNPTKTQVKQTRSSSQKSTEKSPKKMAQKFANEMQSSLGKFMNTQANALKIQEQVMDDIKHFSKNCSQGLHSCIEAVQDIASFDPEVNMKHLRDNMHKAFEQITSMEQMQHLAVQVAQGTRFSELIGVDAKSLQILHKAARRLLETKRYREAESAFCFLTFMDGSKYAFWLGLGHACFHLNHFSQATSAYHMAGVCDPANFWPHMYMANCFEAMRKFNQAQIAIEEADKVFQEQGHGDTSMAEALCQRLQTIKKHS